MGQKNVEGEIVQPRRFFELELKRRIVWLANGASSLTWVP
jgi:hypothetical protein